ncbi:OmpW family protein [Methylobrevis sp. L22]|uniref:OmpW family protein n=1 Tax=Methylobrevis albus TaxID=2793297 RepID=A0A931I0Z6_9HYPH|nr:OmpW family protein [Methylobrevis albus]
MRATLAAAVALAGPSVAAAADPTAPEVIPAGEMALPEAVSPWQVRLRALGVITRDSGAVDGVAGSGLSFSDTVIPELDISYYFTDNIAAELILGTTFANVYGEGSIAGLGRVGKTWLLPPSLTLQYHFTDFGAFKPYIGAGVNYTMFYSQSGAAATSLDVKNSFGVVLQAGFDYMLDEHWGLNVDVKKVLLRPDFDVTVGGAPLSGSAELDPWLIGTGITYRF